MTTVLQLLGDTLRGDKGADVSTSDALSEVDVLGLYFSAHWCPPCRRFTPQLGERYTQLKGAGKKLEIVFVSSDQDDSAFTEYHDEMPFLALPYSKREEKKQLSEMFGVNGIPTLVFVDAKTGKTITTEGRAGISAKSFVEDFPFHPKPVNNLGVSVSGINDKPSLVVLMEAAATEVQQKLSESVQELAETEFKADEAERPVQRFFVGTGEGPLAQIRKMGKLPALVQPHEHGVAAEKGENPRWGCDGCGASGMGKDRFRCTKGCDFDFCGDCHKASQSGLSDEQKKPRMLIFNLKDNGAVYAPLDGKDDVTADNMVAFIDDFKNAKLAKLGA